MNSNILYNRIMAIFGALMTIFYIAIGVYIMTSINLAHIEKFIRYLIGITFVIYGIYRAIRAYNKIKETFFTSDQQE